MLTKHYSPKTIYYSPLTLYHKPMKKFIFLILFMILLYLGGRFMLAWQQPNSESDARVSVIIEKGSSLQTIAYKLEDSELIQDSFAFQWYVRWHKLGRKLQAGEYVIQKNLTFAEMAEVLQQGRSSEVRITIPEGYTVAQMDDLLAKRGLVQPGDFEDCALRCDFSFERESLEGFLFPSTYYVGVQDFNTKLFINRLYNTFTQQIAGLTSDIKNSGRTLDEIIIVASMIEREAFNDSEMGDISHVIWKRLDEGIHLGIDATTRYEKNDWKNPLYTADFEKATPYNTRKVLGLPPTAISNPGIEAIKAAINPTPNKYYYYLHDTSGQIHYGVTLEDHNENKRKYIY